MVNELTLQVLVETSQKLWLLNDQLKSNLNVVMIFCHIDCFDCTDDGSASKCYGFLTEKNVISTIYRVSASCFNHLRNVWIGAMEILLSRKVTQILVEELALIPPHLHVKCDIGNVCCCVDKEFAFTANYTKGRHAFHDWMTRYHPGEPMRPVIHTLGGD